MPRILGVDIPREKRIEASLSYIYGVGPVVARRVLDQAKVDCNKRAKDLTEDEVSRITNIIQTKFVVEGDLRREVNQNIKRMVDIGHYRGLRHRRGLPVHGQRTKTNARTRKGPKKMAVGGKKVKAGKKG